MTDWEERIGNYGAYGATVEDLSTRRAAWSARDSRKRWGVWDAARRRSKGSFGWYLAEAARRPRRIPGRTAEWPDVAGLRKCYGFGRQMAEREPQARPRPSPSTPLPCGCRWRGVSRPHLLARRLPHSVQEQMQASGAAQRWACGLWPVIHGREDGRRGSANKGRGREWIVVLGYLGIPRSSISISIDPGSRQQPVRILALLTHMRTRQVGTQ